MSNGMVDVMAHERYQIFSQPAHVKSAEGSKRRLLGSHKVFLFVLFSLLLFVFQLASSKMNNAEDIHIVRRLEMAMFNDCNKL